jgi:ribonuclease HII
VLKSSYSDRLIEAGCDEVGRGCLAGPVFAAAVILPIHYSNISLNDSKKLTAIQRETLRRIIETDALSFAVAMVDNNKIDEINILQASFLAMHEALSSLAIRPELILIDGNRFRPYLEIPHKCIVKGDGIYLSIAAASVLAKTYRDEYMMKLHGEFPEFGWNKNKGYPTLDHRKVILSFGASKYHRKTFTVQVNASE